MKYNLIVAVCRGNGIGYNNAIPWHIAGDLSYFSKLTKGSGNNVVVMGSHTWKSIEKYNKNENGLSGRHNFILSASGSVNISKISKSNKNIKTFPSIDAVTTYLDDTSSLTEYDEVWIIGGADIYSGFLTQDRINACYVTYIDMDFQCDTFFPNFLGELPWKETQRTTTFDDIYECGVDYVVYNRM
jgi:dihydrofolate reductase